jgi:hypothetical protein
VANRLVILSDIWGFEKSDYIQDYKRFLSKQYDIKVYDCIELAKIDKTHY